MKEVEEVDSHWDDFPPQPVEGQLISTGPSEAEMITIALLMRIYDVQLALLTATNKPVADMVYEKHAAGETLNPPIFIPDIREQDDTE